MTPSNRLTAQPGSGEISSSLFKKLAWRLLPLAAICYAVAIIDRVNIGFAKLEMSADIGLSAAAYGLGAGIFFLAYIFFEVPSNMILERVGAKIWISRIMVTWGIVTIVTGFVQNAEQFYAARIFLGIAEAGFYPGMVFFLSQWFPRKRLAQALSLLVVAGPVGSIFVGPVSGSIMSGFAGAAGLAGWQWLFILQGAPAVLLGVIFYFVASNSPTEARWLSPDEKASIAVALGNGGRVRERASKQFKMAISNKSVWVLGFILAANYMGAYAVIFWIPTILKSTGITDVLAIGYLSAIPPAVAVVATVALGIYCDRSQAHRRILVLGMLIASAGLIASVAFGNQLVPTLLGISIASALFTATGPTIWAITNLQLRGMTAAAAGIALINTVGSMGSFLGPYVMGLGQEWTGNVIVPFVVVTAISVVGALVAASLPKENADVQNAPNATDQAAAAAASNSDS